MAVALPERTIEALEGLSSIKTYTVEDVERFAAIAGLQPLELLELIILWKEEGVVSEDDVFVPVCKWLERNYYIPETGEPIKLYPHQRAILEYIFDFTDFNAEGTHFWTQVVYSTIKKSGKTSLTAGVARWVTEQWKPWPDVLTAANDLTQSRTRIYKAIQTSLELMPGWDDKKRIVRAPNGSVSWNITEEAMRYLPNHGTVKALSSDFRGEAGANPTATFFSELWGFTLDKLLKLWNEMVPVATRRGSFRWAETYAGFNNENGPLKDLYNASVISGEQLNCHTMPTWPTPMQDCNCYNTHGCCPEHDTGDRKDGFGYPMFINKAADLVAYWDTDLRARRLPWQQGEAGDLYYSIQQELFKDDVPGYDRLHRNLWTDSVDAYMPITWWDNNYDPYLAELLAASPETYGIGPKEPLILALDAAVSSDCCSVSAVTRHPLRRKEVCLRACWVWYPPMGGVFNYQDTIEKKVRQMCGCLFDYTKPDEGHKNCAHRQKFNIIVVGYDSYQLHDMVQRLQREGLAWFDEFGQGLDRGKADKQLLDNVRNRQFSHPGQVLLADDGFGPPDGLSVIREQIKMANKKVSPDDNTKCRIIKRDKESKIDSVVSTSMANYECKRLDLE